MSPEPDFLPQRGELAELIRAKDWRTAPIGPPTTWPSSLRTVLRLMLTSRYSMWLGWGPELTFFYNDVYAQETLGPKHPWALGQPARAVWAEIWDTLAIRIDHVMRTGEATWDEGLLLLLARSGYPEETYHTFSYSPAPGDRPGEIGGLFCVVVEETERVIGDRRIALLRDLASSLGQTKTVTDVFAAVESCVGAECRDIPFSLTYLFEPDGKSARLVSRTNFTREHPGTPAHVDLDDECPWPLAEVRSAGTTLVVALRADDEWPTGAWKQSPKQALLIPIPKQGQDHPAGVFIAGMNPHRPLDDTLRSFVELFTGQLAAGLANAQAYEEARRRAEALAEIDRAKTAFFSNVSHEFRTPLTLLLGPTEDALSSPERALRGAELEAVHRNALRLLKLVNALLDFARIEAGRVQASYEPTDLSMLTVDLTSTFRSAVERAGLVLDVACEPLPEPVWVDRDMWEKIVLNLLSNALKFTFEGTIAVRLRWCGGHAELTVRDTGVGIAESELPRVFERFHRIEGGRARTHEGSGIGLALVHELVRFHGGSIRVESQVDAGTTFTISIPSGTAHLAAERIGAPRTLAATPSSAAYVEEALRWVPSTEPPPGTEAPEETADARKITARIVVADDNRDMREYIARLLRQHWTVEAVGDGLAAVEAVQREPADLVVSDVMMPGLDGFGLIRALRNDSRTATTPIILLSARAGEEATAEGLLAGADDYLVKPFSASALLVRVEAQLSAARLRVTLRQSAEAERVRLESMFRESPAAICVLRGPSFVIELVNPLALRVWGKEESVVGKPLLDALPELRGQGFEDMLGGVLRTGAPFRGTEVLARIDREGDGTLTDTYFDFVYVPLPGREGRPDSVFVHAYDVTDKVVARRNLEHLREAEQAARSDAEAANRLKDEFLATMSHELRTPLNAIVGWTALIRKNRGDEKSLERAIATIDRNAKIQSRLIEDILDVSRIVSGKLHLDVRRVDLCAIARAAIDVSRPAAEAKRVRLVADIAPGDSVELVGDADRLQQVAWNLLSNAVKFTPSGGMVLLWVERVNSSVQLGVRDTGAGIAREHLPFVFERFRQVDSAMTRKFGGLGLGLAIVRHLVELHGGLVTAESEGTGKGSTFTVTLPIKAIHHGDTEPQRETPTDAVRARPSAPLTESALGGASILVVDDDEDARLLLQSAFQRAGASVGIVDSAAQALSFLETHAVDLIISDIGMPDEDGFSLMRRVRGLGAGRNGDVPAIALSAYARREDVERALEVGYQRHLAKPADLDELERAAAGMLESRRSAKAP